MKKFRFIDLFCGGGGSITGEIAALKKAGIAYEGRGFNHWNIAIETIRANHPECVPDFERACADIAEISGRPQSVFNDDPTRLDLLWASPSCTHHSNAAGGTPRSEQLRSQPEHLLPFLRLTKCRRMFVENVEELLKWGPLLDRDLMHKGKKYREGQADPRKAGLFFNDWIREIRHSGYDVDYQVMNAADYGAATSRKRLIIQAVRKSSGEKIVWPEPTHAREPGLFGYKPWRSAAEIIDWSIPGESIFDREKPLCKNTIRRIEAGIKKYWGAWAEPFLIILRGTGDDQLSSSAVPLSAPLPTITAGGGHVALISPFLTRYNGGEDRNHEIGAPIPVIDCSNRYGMISPMFIPQQSAGTVKPCAGNPAPTIATSGAVGIISPVIMDMSHPGDHADAARCKGGRDPIGTITCRNNWGVVMPFLSAYYSPGTVTGADTPVPVITTKDRFSLVTPFLTAYYGNGFTSPTTGPVPTICTKDRFGLIQGRILILPDGQRFKLDITHRMLTTKELAAATGFPEDYIFIGGDTAAKKMIGNAVCPDLAKALILETLSA